MIFEPLAPRLRLMMRQKLGLSPMAETEKIEGMLHPFNKKRFFRYAVLLYTLVLLSGNFAGYHSWQILHFSYPAGTLLIQFAFCCTICFTETVGFRKTSQLIWGAALTNLLVALFIHYILELPVSEFWVNTEIDNFEGWNQFSVLLMLTMGYICSSLAMVKIAGFLRVLMGRGWLLLRVLLILLTALFVDMLVLMPVLLFVAPDRYMAFWKMLSLMTVKISLSLVAIPISYFMVRIFKKRNCIAR